jgi:hypothetical protein
VLAGGTMDMVLKELASDYRSHEPIHGDHAARADGAGACC